MENLHLTPLTGAILVFILVVAGHRFRKAWAEREEDSKWAGRAWGFGLIALMVLLALAFIPLKY